MAQTLDLNRRRRVRWAAALPLLWLACAGAVLAAAPVSALKSHNIDQPIDISADRLEVRSKENIAIFEGRVEAVQRDLTLKADRVTVYYKSGNEAPKATANDSTSNGPPPISRIDAAGGVQMVSPSETAGANWGVYDLDQRIVTLGGSVVLTRGDTTARGDRLQINLDSGVTRLETVNPGGSEGGATGRVRGRFVPAEKPAKAE